MPGLLDATTLVVMSNRMDNITREMTNTVIRAARSTTMAARDFSCCIVSADSELLSCPEGMPVHVFGMGPSAEAMKKFHPEFGEGDAFLHNDPYSGNSHAADHQILVPVMLAGEHLFTACVKAHQVDVGNSLPTTYMPLARDVYEEGALIFPCVRVQEDYADVQDVIRMCERRIRSFDIWYGDYLAQLGAARLAERRLKEYVEKFGLETVKAFVTQWLDYSERVTGDAIARLPAGKVSGSTCLDPFPGAPDGIPLSTEIAVDPAGREVVVDLRDNPDCLPNGLNLTETTARNAAITGVLCILNSTRRPGRVIVPNNAGSFRRIKVLLRENCVVGIPRHPVSCSVATNTVADRVQGMVVFAFAGLPGSAGLAEPCYGSPPFMGVVSGRDRRRDDAFYILQIVCGTAGGPGSAEGDGWLMLLLAAAGGVAYMDSSEVSEQKYPLVIWQKTVRADSEGAGAGRGAPGATSIYGPRVDPMTVHYFLDGVLNRPKGVRGGGSPVEPQVWRVEADGDLAPLRETIGEAEIEPRQSIVSLSQGGGGYGHPFDRDPELVLEDVRDEWVTPARAESIYGVVLNGDPDRWETLTVDVEATARRRAEQRGETATDDPAAGAGSVAPWWTAADLELREGV